MKLVLLVGGLFVLIAAPLARAEGLCWDRANLDYKSAKAKVRATGVAGVVRRHAMKAVRSVRQTWKAVCAGSVVSREGGSIFADVWTDALDYTPGTPVTITGSGWFVGEVVTLTITAEPATYAAVVLSAVADADGSITNAAFAPTDGDVGTAFTLVATGALSGRVAQTVFWDSRPATPLAAPLCMLGTAEVDSVVATNGDCVQDTINNNNSVESWDVEQGRTYAVTLHNVTECTGNTIQVIVKSSETGNQCLTATLDGSGDYVFSITLPDNACFTMPITYCTSGCDESTGEIARRSDGACKQSHLRAAVFTAGCEFPVQDEDCPTRCNDGIISGRKCSDISPPDGHCSPSEPGVGGVKIMLGGDASGCALTAGGTGSYAFTGLPPGSYTVTEEPPAGAISTTPTTCPVTIDDDCNVSSSCDFGNVCLGAGGGLTLGFWSNKNGQAVLNDGGTLAPELALLSGLCARDETGGDFDPTTYSSFRTWLLDAHATNMSYMLSAQLSAMELNVEAAFVSGGSYVYAPSLASPGACPYGDSLGFIGIGSLMSAANAELCADGDTPAGDPNRACQEAKKTALDDANNNHNFAVACPDVQGNACP